MRSEQVYWVFTVSVDQMDKFTPLIPKLVAATEKEPGALQGGPVPPNGKLRAILEGFFAVAKLTRWVIYGTPSDEFKKANADFHPIYMTPFDGFVR
jgi:hypothetical protein